MYKLSLVMFLKLTFIEHLGRLFPCIHLSEAFDNNRQYKIKYLL